MNIEEWEDRRWLCFGLINFLFAFAMTVVLIYYLQGDMMPGPWETSLIAISILLSYAYGFMMTAQCFRRVFFRD